MRDLIIIGAGAAGLSAAVYALGKKLNFLIIYDELGGKSDWDQSLADQNGATTRVGSEAVRLFARQVGSYPEHVLRDRVTGLSRLHEGFEVETLNHSMQTSRAVIIATGASPVELDVPYAQEFVGHGLGYSVTTYTHLLAGKTAAIIGTGERALRGAGELARIARQVYLIMPTPTPSSDITPLLPAMGRTIEAQPNVEVFAGYRVKEIIGVFHAGEVVIEKDNKTRSLGVDAAFVDLGLRPNTEFVRGLMLLDTNGFIRVDERNATTVPGLFAAGDVTTAFGEQVVIAMGEGARAALSAYDYLLAEPATYIDRPMD